MTGRTSALRKWRELIWGGGKTLGVDDVGRREGLS